MKADGAGSLNGADGSVCSVMQDGKILMNVIE